MNHFFAYTRVSTAKQGARGVSLHEQRDAIARHAERFGLTIVRWFEERQTAAKRGRPVFTQMLKLLRGGKADGVIIHKIDRSARNLRDWADLGELLDHGIQVQFANESLDLHSRGGRLSADIQAVVAADYVRNLREEAKKGFYGRIKQGFFPLPAPIGYRDCGKARAKEPDRIAGPLVRTAFELYATGRYNLERLVVEMAARGLRNRRGRPVTLNGFSTLLNNPFYIGLIRLKRTGELFPGAHTPLITKALFDRAQHVLHGRTNARPAQHDFLFRRLLTCSACEYSLIGELQKGRVYYRCHSKICSRTSVREDSVDAEVRRALQPLVLDDDECRYALTKLESMKTVAAANREAQIAALTLRFGQLRDRLTRLTDAYLDGAIERPLFDDRKAALILEQRDVEEALARVRTDTRSVAAQVADYLELAGSALLQYEIGLPDERRDLLQTLTSNRQVAGKNVAMTLAEPFRTIANRPTLSNGGPYRDVVRTWDRLLDSLARWAGDPRDLEAAEAHSSGSAA